MLRTAPLCAGASLICRRASARTFTPISACVKVWSFSVAYFGNHVPSASSASLSFSSAPGSPLSLTVRQRNCRVECGKSSPLLLADPRPRSSDTRRTDDWRRPAVAAPILGADRSDPFPPPSHEHRRRDRVYGRSRAVRLARRDERRKSAGGRCPGATQGANWNASHRGRTHSLHSCPNSSVAVTGDCTFHPAASSVLSQ